MKTSFRGLSLIASLAVLAMAAPAFAAIYAPIEDAELLRRADTVVLARASDSVVVATPGGLPETRTTFAVVDTFTGKDQPALEVVVPGGELPSGLALVLDGVPRFTPGAVYILALNARGDGTYVPTELGLGAFDIVRDEAGRDYATRSMFRGEKVAVREREADGSLVERREPLRELAAFASYVGAELFREAPVPGPPAYVGVSGAGELKQVRQGGVSALWDDHWCPNGVPGTCGDNFIRYRWVNPVATVRYCDENPSTPGQSGVPGGGEIELERAVGMWVSDPNSEINYTYGGAVTGTCAPGSVPAAGTIPIYFDNLSMFGGQGLSCPLTVDGLLAIGGNVIDQTTHAFKGTTYKTIRGGIGWVRGAGSSFCGEYYAERLPGRDGAHPRLDPRAERRRQDPQPQRPEPRRRPVRADGLDVRPRACRTRSSARTTATPSATSTAPARDSSRRASSSRSSARCRARAAPASRRTWP